MSLENYLVRGCAPYSEMRLDFENAQVQQLCNLLKATGYKKHRAFVLEHLEDIQKYISISPSQRQQKKWVNRPDILLIRFSALQISFATVSLLEGIRPIAYLVDGGSYRQFHTAVSEGLIPVLLSNPFAQFPFEGFENPFFP